MAEGRVAGAEVVDGDADAHGPELGQGLGRPLRVLHQDALGDLEDEPVGVDTAQGQGGADLVGQMGRDQLAPGQVDREGEIVAADGCSSRPAARRLRPAPTGPRGTMKPGLLGDGDEAERGRPRPGWDGSTGRVLRSRGAGCRRATRSAGTRGRTRSGRGPSGSRWSGRAARACGTASTSGRPRRGSSPSPWPRTWPSPPRSAAVRWSCPARRRPRRR